MKKIFLIATGGTIASREGKNGLRPGAFPGAAFTVCAADPGALPDQSSTALILDSTNMQPSDWLCLAKLIRNVYEKYDGFVILHGTDTMAYTAAALSYLIQNSRKPIVLTGAQKPIDQDITDARSNVLQSVRYVCDDRASDVNFVFNGEVIAGTRGRKIRTKSFNAFPVWIIRTWQLSGKIISSIILPVP